MIYYVEQLDYAHAYDARAIAIVIDVIRAFTVAGYAFAGGAETLYLVNHVGHAPLLRQYYYADALLAGEVNGHLIPGFDLNNSPAAIQAVDLRGKTLIQCTGAGTRGALSVLNAKTILLCALTNAQATATYARQLIDARPSEHQYVSILPTGMAHDFVYGNEDTLCAEYLTALITGRPRNAPELLNQITTQLRDGDRFDLWKQNDPDLPSEDIDAVLDANRFNFVMAGTVRRDLQFPYLEVKRVDIGT